MSRHSMAPAQVTPRARPSKHIAATTGRKSRAPPAEVTFLDSPSPTAGPSHVHVAAGRHTSPPSKACKTGAGRRGRHSAADAPDGAFGAGSSPDPLAFSVSPEVKRGRKRKAAHTNEGVADEAREGLDAKGLAGVGTEGQEGDEKKEGFTDEEKHDMWLDFAAERYEIVEQLPLELHRNFRLLRELDDGCVSQSEKLQEQMRAYISARFELVRRIDAVAEALASTVSAEQAGEAVDGGMRGEVAEDSAMESHAPSANGDARRVAQKADGAVQAEPGATGEPAAQPRLDDTDQAAQSADPPSEADKKVEGTAMTPNMPLDGEHADIADIDHALGGTTGVPMAETDQAEATRDGTDAAEALGVTATDGEGLATAGTEPVVEDTEQNNKETVPSPDTRLRPSRFLPEIGRLAREIVRNCEEKVAVATGAYNSIDRHIRALDSHLSAQETSLILGLRSDTLPSAGADAAASGFDATGAAGAGLGQSTTGIEEGGEVVMGVGGGTGGRRSRKKGRGRKKDDQVVDAAGAASTGVGEAGMEMLGGMGFEILDADPNEPRYCYCDRVSFGEMVACENEDCPLEWFHLSCTGLTVPPVGKWWCNVCKPKAGFVPPGVTLAAAAAAARAAAAGGGEGVDGHGGATGGEESAKSAKPPTKRRRRR